MKLLLLLDYNPVDRPMSNILVSEIALADLKSQSDGLQQNKSMQYIDSHRSEEDEAQFNK